MVSDNARFLRPPVRAGSTRVRTLVALIAGAALMLTAAACGGSPSSTESGRTSSAGAPSNTQSVDSETLAFSRCMRANGVPNFPDPNTSGVWPKPQVEGVASSPQYPAAARACGHLLPDGGPGVAPSQAVDQKIQNDMTKFAQCMRTHGVSEWPDPTLDQGRAVFDPQAAGIDTNSPQISAKVHECEHVFPASIGIPPGA